ncbi:hypothetical protein C0581_02000 [Candidatus Parcubacteria bacterium]|nr:MAG: hypothetical protein C0581_02000 [Candidatus Parcubacteria bacterium]
MFDDIYNNLYNRIFLYGEGLGMVSLAEIRRKLDQARSTGECVHITAPGISVSAHPSNIRIDGPRLRGANWNALLCSITKIDVGSRKDP